MTMPRVTTKGLIESLARSGEMHELTKRQVKALQERVRVTELRLARRDRDLDAVLAVAKAARALMAAGDEYSAGVVLDTIRRLEISWLRERVSHEPGGIHHAPSPSEGDPRG